MQEQQNSEIKKDIPINDSCDFYGYGISDGIIVDGECVDDPRCSGCGLPPVPEQLPIIQSILQWFMNLLDTIKGWL